LGWPEAEKLQQMTDEAMASLAREERPSESGALHRLDDYVSSLDEACYHLKNRMGNLALRNNLLPWIELLEHWHWMTKRAVTVLLALDKGEDYEQPLHWMKESMEEVRKHPKRIAGNVLLPLADYVLEKTGDHNKSKESLKPSM
jgi:hyaluronoglucosaminidase